MGSISPAPVFRHVQKAVYFPELNTDIRGFLPFTQTKSAEQSKKSRKIASPQNTADIYFPKFPSLRASSPIWASKASLARTRARGARSRETHFARPNRRACPQARSFPNGMTRTIWFSNRNYRFSHANCKLACVAGVSAWLRGERWDENKKVE